MSVYVVGRVNIDFIIEIDGVIERGKKFRGRVVEVDVGGTAANIATAIVRIDKSFNTKLLGAIGNDYKDFIFKKLNAEGIDLGYIKVLNYETGKAYIFIDPEGESTIISIPGANDLYSDEFVPRIEDAKVLVLGNTTLSASNKLLDTVPVNAILFIDPHSLWSNIWGKVKDLGNQCFYLPNENELKLYASIDANDIDAMKRYYQVIGCAIVVKRGEKGVVAIHEGHVIKMNAVKLSHLGLNLVSTAGCGDAFTGVFVAMYMRNNDIVESLKYATVAAALKATKISSRDSPRIDELESFTKYVENRGLLKIDISTL